MFRIYKYGVTCDKHKFCLLRTALFWDVSQRVVVISYPRFGTTYRSHLQGSSQNKMSTIRCVTIQKTAVLSYFAAEASNDEILLFHSCDIVTVHKCHHRWEINSDYLSNMPVFINWIFKGKPVHFFSRKKQNNSLVDYSGTRIHISSAY